ncbi:hypothetical protein Slin15195_G086250 [Septoria linicola]|uniref:Uncharacterized protein n=1 Tax=Septoria linicola TaxID=215465 RepID=A0A9Q9EKZ6_9PEZI|nr:hypothetical protein Slin14017_G088840 [Septoria linicola]USW55306.1 hypothetical protein Slin15195_G086250 [Septoria linicola]
MAPTPTAQTEDAPAADTAEVRQGPSSSINSPSCQLSDKVLSTSYATPQGPLSPEAILRLLRNQICNDAKCEAPDAINRDAVVVARDDFSIYKKCEISVGLANGLEGYVFRQTEPIGELQNECSESIDNMIDEIGGVAKECWWVGSHKNQVYQAGFRHLNPIGNNSLHMQNNTKIVRFLADAAPSTDVEVKHKGKTPKGTIPIVVGVVGGVILIILSLVIFLIWKRNKRERQRWRAALERRARRKAKKHGHGGGPTASGHSTTLLGSLTGNKSWNPLGNAYNQTAALPPDESQTSSESRESKEKEKIPVTNETVAAGLHDEAIARRLQKKYDAAHERAIQGPDADRDTRRQSPQPPGYDAVNSGNAMDMVQGPQANRISHFAPSLGPDRFRCSDVTREEEIPPLPPPPTRDGPSSPKSPIKDWHDAEEYASYEPPQQSPPRNIRSPTGWRNALDDRALDNYTTPPDRPLPARPLRSPKPWRDAFDDRAMDGYIPPEKLLPERPSVKSPPGWRPSDDDGDE